MDYQLKLLTLSDGRCPFERWYNAFRDRVTVARIYSRLTRIRDGNFGDSKSIGDGVHELRIDIGPGYRVYFAIAKSTLVVLIGGGDKDTQDRDVANAKRLWQENKDDPERFRRNF